VSVVAIDEAVTGGALRATHFFNGRLLTGEDLDREQRVQAARLARLGTAVGDGVVEGLTLQVTAGSTAARPIVTISPGLAISRSGLALELPDETDVALARSAARPGSEPGGLFADCQPYTASEYSTGAGIYLLSIGPAEREEGLARVSGLHNADAPCNTAYAVEAVNFRLVRIALPLSELDDRDHLRNRVAYRMFAPREVGEFERDPFGHVLMEYGLIDQLRGTCLSNGEVPLALIGWEAGEGIVFVDHWSVRRRPTRPTQPGRFRLHASDRQLAEGEARFLQFQEQLGHLRLTGLAIETLAASSRFVYLPAAGFLPLGDEEHRGFGYREFLSGLSFRGPVHIEADHVAGLIRESFVYPPIDLNLAEAEAVWVYLVRDNLIPLDDETGEPMTYALFASGHTRYRADARFELSYWSYANFAEIG
jgi:hypothetical protein